MISASEVGESTNQIREADLFSISSVFPASGRYVELVPGIYATSAPEINRQPQFDFNRRTTSSDRVTAMVDESSPKIREGVCGTAITRVQEDELPDGTQTGAQGKTLFLHWLWTSKIMIVFEEGCREEILKISILPLHPHHPSLCPL